jgi:hypothetical protein
MLSMGCQKSKYLKTKQKLVVRSEAVLVAASDN